MNLDQLDPIKCTGCCACELACELYHDKLLGSFRSSIMLHRDEKRNYFGPMIKIKQDIILGRPEGAILASQLEQKPSSEKPILLRPECDDCDGKYLCAKFCPSGALKV